jgi:cobalt/nickel transport system permease protein
LARNLTRIAPRHGFLAGAAGVAALVSVPASALAFSALYALGGAVAIPMGQLVTAMLVWHLVIGLGEALITAAVVSAVLASRPDLVFLARRHTPPALLVDAAGNPVPTATTSGSDRPVAAPTRRWWAIAAGVPVLIAGVLALTASAQPDGLTYVAETLGFAGAEQASATAGSPLAGYDVRGWGSAWATGAAGVFGLAVVAILAYLSLALVASRRHVRA